MKQQRFSNAINIRNRQATFEYELLDKYTAGLVLMGTEIKSIREGKVNLQDGYCYINNGEFFVKGINITPYAEGTHYNHEATRERKLLLKRVGDQKA
jgi:SsrA-binding protein